MGTKAQPGPFDCYAAAELDEPLFVLLARDSKAPHAVRQWVKMRKSDRASSGLEPNDEKTLEAEQCIRDMVAWRAAREGSPEKVDPVSPTLTEVDKFGIAWVQDVINRAREGEAEGLDLTREMVARLKALV